jgi:hypothetical protein
MVINLITVDKDIQKMDVYELIDTYILLCRICGLNNEIGKTFRQYESITESLEKSIEGKIKHNLLRFCEIRNLVGKEKK